MEKDLKWKRFWCPREKTFEMSDQGFLADPEAEYGKFLNPNLSTLRELGEKRCLVFLGEPGIGKSWEISHQIADVEKNLSAAGDQLLYLDLRSFASEDRLLRALFGSPQVESWRSSGQTLHLFLDS